MQVLIDEEQWFQQHGLAAKPRYGFDSYNNQQATRQRIQQERDYQKAVLEKIFVEDQTQLERNFYSQDKQEQNLEQWKDSTVTLKVKSTTKNDPSPCAAATAADDDNDASTCTLISANLAQLARRSPMIYTMAYMNMVQTQRQHEKQKEDGSSSPPHKQLKQSNSDSDDEKQVCGNSSSSSSRAVALTLSLEEYSLEVVESFLALLLEDASKTKDGDDEELDNQTQQQDKLPDYALDNLNPDHVVDCCRLAHYLQCTSIVYQLAEEILLPSIDSQNCMSLCQLAEQLSLPPLHEASLNHILWSLDKVERESSSSEEEASSCAATAAAMLNNDYLTPELKKKIEHIKRILMKQNRKTIFFDTFVEYIAMLAEQYQYNKERLDEATEQQLQNEEGTQGWLYAQSKIEKQTVKVQAMRAFLTDQKKIFGVGGSTTGS
ncbi:MAG: hypothetical protein SGILL_004203 [Bacillariaceae sp.]